MLNNYTLSVRTSIGLKLFIYHTIIFLYFQQLFVSAVSNNIIYHFLQKQNLHNFRQVEFAQKKTENILPTKIEMN